MTETKRLHDIPQRDVHLDNLKGFLMISVVYVHIYDMLGVPTPLLYTVRMVLLTVQMPLFLFLCGYFGKHIEQRQKTALSEYLLPYLMFNSFYYLMRVEQEQIRYSLFRPLNMYWFLMTLLLIRLLLPQLLRIRGLPLLSVGLALLAGTDKYFGRLLSLSRTVCFFPFYLAGLYCPKEYIERVRRVPMPMAILCGLSGSLITLGLTEIYQPYEEVSHPFQMINTYAKQQLSLSEGILFRLSFYIAAPLTAILLIRLMPRQKGLLTKIGQSSMTVYLLHAFPMLWIIGHREGTWVILCRILPILTELKQPAKLFGGLPQMGLFWLYSLVISMLLSSTPVRQLYTQLFGELRRLLFHEEKMRKNSCIDA